MTRPKAVLVPLAALLLLASRATAQDDGGLYFELGAGVTGTEDMDGPTDTAEFDPGYHLAALLGYEWKRAVGTLDFSLELEGYYNRQSFDDGLLLAGSATGDYLAHAGVIAGGVLTYPLSDALDLYGGLGVGYATALNLSTRSDALSGFDFTDDGALLGQAKVGLRYALAQELGFFAQYRRIQSEELTLEDSTLGSSFDYEIQQNVVEIGLRWGL